MFSPELDRGVPFISLCGVIPVRQAPIVFAPSVTKPNLELVAFAMREAKYLIKQTGHVIAKTRFVSAQLNAWFKDSLWLKLAKIANKNALYLRKNLLKFDEFKVLFPTHGNEVFFEINKDTYNHILRLNIFPNLWGKINDNRLVIRFVTSFETTTREIDEIIDRLDGTLNRS